MATAVIVKIISGGQSGVDRAALDVAIKLGIPHGGWVPKGRLTEDGPLPEIYALRETPTAAYAERTEKNVVDSDGTLIISRGELTGGSEYTREMALKHGRPWLHIDLKQTAAFRSIIGVTEWLSANDIRVLNVAGPRASKDPTIYRDAAALLESLYYLSLSAPTSKKVSDAGSPEPKPSDAEKPARVRDVVERLQEDLPLKDRVLIANMSESELPALGRTLGEYIVNRFGLATGNTALRRSCRWVARRPVADEAAAAAVIIRALWKQLRRTHPLRSVK
jgi:hypothetical protein